MTTAGTGGAHKCQVSEDGDNRPRRPGSALPGPIPRRHSEAGAARTPGGVRGVIMSPTDQKQQLGDDRVMRDDEPKITALVCASGHVVAASLPYSDRRAFCPECGKPAIGTCETCGAEIPGSDPMWGGTWRPNKHCAECGAAYPWTLASKRDAEELLDLLDKLKPEERDALKRSLDDLMTDTSRTELAAARFKVIAMRAGAEGAGIIRAVVTALATDAARRSILGV